MNTKAYGTTVFCDDIRFEASGKLTLVGCYTGELNFIGPAPGRVPIFAALVSLRVPKGVLVEKVDLRVIKELNAERDEIFQAEFEISKDEFQKVFEPIDGGGDVEKIMSMTIPIQWSPLEFSNEGFIKVRAYLNGETEVRLGALKINFSDTLSADGDHQSSVSH